jgi:hypothetical protein
VGFVEANDVAKAATCTATAIKPPPFIIHIWQPFSFEQSFTADYAKP